MIALKSSLTYSLLKPEQVDPDKSYPALFLMHGMGSNEQDLLPLVAGLEEKFFIFSIRGPLVQPPGFAFFTIEGFGKPDRHVFDETVGMISNFIDDVLAEYPVDPNQLYLAGFSQGAILSMSLAIKLGNRIKGIAALSGYIPRFVKEEYEKNPVEELSLFISHGEFDQILPYQWGVENDEYFRSLGAKVAFHSYPAGHTVSLKNQQDFTQWLINKLEK
ncbi:dienelactone hydrolase family protein [Neobacillus sp. 114]|uniref:alpha/beta hydrolase n=1 Tax=Neobacillus sp. 114 TaxID=3048535 RepID=UPI0032E47CFD